MVPFFNIFTTISREHFYRNNESSGSEFVPMEAEAKCACLETRAAENATALKKSGTEDGRRASAADRRGWSG